MPSLKEGSIVKVDHFEVARCSSMYTITDHPFLIHFISLTIIDEQDYNQANSSGMTYQQLIVINSPFQAEQQM
ncbi:unnamed protein product [Brassica oleracea]